MLLLFVPFGLVPINELSPLLMSVTGKPLAKRVMPETDQPRVIRFERKS
jgi:hypothetical protein